jgi:hypothetical protein
MNIFTRTKEMTNRNLRHNNIPAVPAINVAGLYGYINANGDPTES